MVRGFRRSLAVRLVAGGCALALVVVGGVAAYLIFSRASQTTAAALSNADNRVAVMAQVLDRFTGAEELSAASSLASQASLSHALSGASPTSAVPALFASGTSPAATGETLLVSDARGVVVYSRAASGAPSVSTVAPPAALRSALAGASCALGGTPVVGGCGIEVLPDGMPAYVVALPVGGAGRVVGAVAYVAPLSFQLSRFEALFGFPTAFINAADIGHELRAGSLMPADGALRSALATAGGTRHATYSVPDGGGGTEVAGSFLPVDGPNRVITGYIGIEVPLSLFAGDERTDIVVLALIAVLVLLLVVIAVVLFVQRFVRRPIARLEEAVAQIADGDYTTVVRVDSDDELGRLGGNVNRMRHAIAGYVGAIQEARARLDVALERVSGVSRALTTTTAGLASLRGAVVATAALIAGESASAILATREGDRLVAVAIQGDPPALGDVAGVNSLIEGRNLSSRSDRTGGLAGVPMFYQGTVVGALLVFAGPAGPGLNDSDVEVLSVLANNAAIAMENSRLFEQERETVQRLLQLDSLKGDFLATVQHELRTPLTAILGLAELLETYWERWADAPKLDAVRDIQTAANNLHDIVETIIDYSGIDEKDLGLQPILVPARDAVEASIAVLAERHRAALPVGIEVRGGEGLTVLADPGRLSKVLRALLDNAVKFSDGRGQVLVDITPSEDGGRRETMIAVRDQGIGIADDDLPRIFDRFFQVDNTATRRFGGTGMGLAMVKRLVDGHGATIAVASAVGVGTTVSLCWPAAAVTEQSATGLEGGEGDPTGAVSEAALPLQ